MRIGVIERPRLHVAFCSPPRQFKVRRDEVLVGSFTFAFGPVRGTPNRVLIAFLRGFHRIAALATGELLIWSGSNWRDVSWSDEKGLSIVELHAAARLSEICAVENITHSRIAWICAANGVPGVPQNLHLDRDPGARTSRDQYFRLFSTLHAHDGFGTWLADLLEVLVGVYHRTRQVRNATGVFPPLVYPSIQDSRTRMLRGEWGWAIGIRAIQLLGFDLAMGENALGEQALVLKPILDELERRAGQGRLRESLSQGHGQTLVALDGAYDAYLRGGPDGRRQAMDSLRNALENLVRDFTNKDLSDGLRELSLDDSKRLALFKGLRDFLAVEGTHADDQPLHDDFYMSAHITEDVLTWILQRKEQW